MNSAENNCWLEKHHSEYLNAFRNRDPVSTLGKVFFVCWDFFSLPLLPDEGQHSAAIFREFHRLIQALVQMPLCLQTCWSSAFLFTQQNQLFVVHVLDEVLLSEQNKPGSSVCCCLLSGITEITLLSVLWYLRCRVVLVWGVEMAFA